MKKACASRGNLAHSITTILIGLIWLSNSTVKIFGLVPRHEEIVARILGEDNANSITIGIGILEALMAIWIFSKLLPRLNAIIQVCVIGLMNILEFFIAQDLLLWGKFNSIFAAILIAVITINYWYLRPSA